MIGFASIGHAFASVLHGIVKVARIVEPVIAKVQGQEATVEALTSLVNPAAAGIERLAFAALGVAAHAVHSADDAASANGVNVQLDAALVADIKALIATVKDDLHAAGIPQK